MSAIVGLLATLLILEGTGFWSVDFEAHPLIWILLPVGTPLAGAGIALVLARRNVPSWRRRRLLRGFYLLAYLAMYAVVVYPAGWADFVLVRLGWLGRPLVGHALLVLPGILLALWVALWFYRADGQFLTRQDRDARQFFPWLRSGARLIAVPAGVVAMAIAVTEALGQIPELGSFLEIHPSMAILLGLVLLAWMVTVFPALILLAWPSEPLPDGELRSSLEEMSARVGVKLRDVRIWKRTTTLVNACILGHFSGGRRVLFTRGAREYLTDDDLRAVFAHEISHISSGHLWCYSALLVAYVLSLNTLEQALDVAPPWVTGLAVLAFTAAVWWILFGCLSRRLEMEADMRGAELVPPGAYVAAFDRIRCILGITTSRRGGWRHFSLDRRHEILSSALTRPEARRALYTNCRRWKLAGYGLLLVAIVGFLWSTGREFARPESVLTLDRGAYVLGQADDLRRVLEARESNPTRPPWPPWLDRGSGRIEQEYTETLARAQASFEPLEGESLDPATAEKASSLRAALEEHLSWWAERDF